MPPAVPSGCSRTSRPEELPEPGLPSRNRARARLGDGRRQL